MVLGERLFSARLRSPGRFFLSCMLGAFEGTDIASIGLTLSRLARVLPLDPAQAGICASAGMVGLTIGAVTGGRLADRYGSRFMLFLSTLLLALCSMATAMTWSFESLALARLATGLSIGAQMPILLTLVADASEPDFRSRATGIFVASGGIGGIIAGLVSLHPDWRAVYIYGGIGPLLALAPIWFTHLKRDGHSAAPGSRNERAIATILFGGNRAAVTLSVWAVSFCTTLVHYIFINWLPSLLVLRAFSESQSRIATILYSVGAICGNLFAGYLVDRHLRRTTYCIAFAGASFCAFGLSVVTAPLGSYALSFGVGFFMICAQLITFTLTPGLYPLDGRATGVGAMVAAGRSGSVLGPLLIGQLLHIGLTAEKLLVMLIPGCGISLIFGLLFLWMLDADKSRAAMAVAPSAAAAE